jgi:hypothetical protein
MKDPLNPKKEILQNNLFTITKNGKIYYYNKRTLKAELEKQINRGHNPTDPITELSVSNENLRRLGINYQRPVGRPSRFAQPPPRRRQTILGTRKRVEPMNANAFVGNFYEFGDSNMSNNNGYISNNSAFMRN